MWLFRTCCSSDGSPRRQVQRDKRVRGSRDSDGIKSFSDWTTIPQLYVKGEFVGGSDIIKEMYESGEIQSFFESKNINLNPENNQNEGS